MDNLEQIYKNRINEFSKKAYSVKKKRNIITICKVLCFCLIIYMGYRFIASNNADIKMAYDIIFLYTAIACIPVYLLLNILDSKILTQINNFAALIKCNNTELEYIKGDYRNLKNGDEFINPLHPYSYDLDVFGENSLYQEINRTTTRNGAVRLAKTLETNCLNTNEIKQRQEVVIELKDKIDFCHNFRAAGINNPVGELQDNIIEQWVKEKPFFKNWKYIMPLIYLSNFIMAGLIIATYFLEIKIGYFLCMFLIQLCVVMYRVEPINNLVNRLGTFIKALSNYIYLIEQVKDKEFSSIGMIDIKNEIFGKKDAIKAFKQLKRIQDTLDSRINVVVMVILNGLYMRDFHTIYRLEKWKQDYLKNVNGWIESITSLDVYISMANFNFNHREYIMPQINESTEIFSAIEMGHPLLHCQNIVTNNFIVNSIHNFHIITGANMAGKSTFLRAVGINMILALSGNTVFAKEFTCTPIQLFTSMRTTDNLSKGTSYFHAELLRLKALIDMAHTTPIFIILDEMLKGTNSKDKLNGSIKFLEKLLTLNVCGVVATHDLALGELKNIYPQNFNNVCFEIEHTKDDIQYDYKLKNGVSKNMNASILLEKMGLI